MPSVRGPWNVRTNAPNPAIGYGTRRGDISVVAAVYMGAVHNWVELTKDVPAEEDADSVNVRLERPIFLRDAFATAFSLFGYASAAVEVSLIAREGGLAAESRQELVPATSVAVYPEAPDLSGRDWEFPDQRQPLFFERPSANPGNVTVGLRVDCFAGAGGFFVCGAQSKLTTSLEEMTVEWLWPA